MLSLLAIAVDPAVVLALLAVALQYLLQVSGDVSRAVPAQGGPALRHQGRAIMSGR